MNPHTDIVRVKRTWTHETEMPHEYLGTRNVEDIFMEAYTQGDGEATDEIVALDVPDGR